MNTKKLIKKLEHFFDYPKKKQRKKHDKLLEIVRKLERKKSKVQLELDDRKRHAPTSDRYHELNHELKVVTGLIDKANELVESNLPDD